MRAAALWRPRTCGAGATASSPSQPRLALSPVRAWAWHRRGRTGSGRPASMLAGARIGRAEALSEAGRHREAIAAAEERGRWSMTAGQPAIARGYALLALARAHSDLGEVAVARELIDRGAGHLRRTGRSAGRGARLPPAGRGAPLRGAARPGGGLPSARTQLYAQAGAMRERGIVAEDIAYVLTIAGGRQATSGSSGHHGSPSAAATSAARPPLGGRRPTPRSTAATSTPRCAAAREARAPAAPSAIAGSRSTRCSIEALVRSAAGTACRSALAWSTRLLAIADSVGARHLRALVLGAGARAAQRDGHPRRAFGLAATMRATLPTSAPRWRWPRSTCSRQRSNWSAAPGTSSIGRRATASDSRRGTAGTCSSRSPPLLRGRALLGAGARRRLPPSCASHAAACRPRRCRPAWRLIAEAALRQATVLLAMARPLTWPCRRPASTSSQPDSARTGRDRPRDAAACCACAEATRSCSGDAFARRFEHGSCWG